MGGASSAPSSQPTSACSSQPSSQPCSRPTSRPESSLDPSKRPDAITEQAIQTRFEHLQQAKGLDPQIVSQASDLYRQALDVMRQAKEWSAKAAEFEATEKDAPAQAQALQAQLAQKPDDPKVDLPANATIAQCEAAVNSLQMDYFTARRDATALEQEPQRRADRRQEIPRLLMASRQNSEDIRKQLDLAAPTGEDSELTQARKALLQAQDQLLRRQMYANWREMRSYDASNPLLMAQRDLAARRVTYSQQCLKMAQDLLAQRRKDEAQTLANKAVDLTQSKYARTIPVFRALAQENVELAQQRLGKDGMTSKLEQVSANMDRLTAMLTKLRDARKNVTERLTAGGNSSTIGELLRRQRNYIREVRQQTDAFANYQSEVSRVQLLLIDLEDQRSACADVAASTREWMDKLPPAQAKDRDLEAAVKQLLQSRRDSLDALMNDYNSYFSKLVDLDTMRRFVIAAADEFSQYIDEHVLWIRSAGAMGESDLSKAWGLSEGFVAEGGAVNFGVRVLAGLRENFGWAIAGVLLLAGLIVGHRWAARRLAAIGARVEGYKTSSFSPTLRALGLTFFMSAWLPAMVWLASVAMNKPGAMPGVAAGLQMSAAWLLIAGLLLHVCRPNGLAEAHFEWPSRTLQSLRRSLWGLILLSLPPAFVLAVVEAEGNDSVRNSLGRLMFLLTAIVVAGFVHRVLYPKGRIMKSIFARGQGGWLYRLRYVTYALAMGLPVGLAVSAAMGYYYTAIQLSWRLEAMAWLVLGLLLLNGIVLRWLSLSRQSLALRNKREHAQLTAMMKDPSRPAALKKPSASAEANIVSVESIDARSRQFVKFCIVATFVVGAWLIWSDVSPAFESIGKYELWTHSVKVSPTEGQVAGLTEKIVPVTLKDLLLAAIVGILTALASKDLPSLMDVMLFVPLKWSLGARYAFSTVLRYAITVVGCVIALGLLGISWASTQWLVAGVTVGLGFGLQEIFANFVSGLIVLFERPIRVGDVVTVGDISGTVSRIRIRATTITDFDRKELIVPNKEFITSKLVNWTLSDTILRVVIRVGVAYGTDIKKAQEILLSLARANPIVMEKPAPEAYFMNFGDSNLEIELRVFVRDMTSYQHARHQLNMAIHDAFREANIEMAFPQRDLNIRTMVEPLPVVIKPGATIKERVKEEE